MIQLLSGLRDSFPTAFAAFDPPLLVSARPSARPVSLSLLRSWSIFFDFELPLRRNDELDEVGLSPLTKLRLDDDLDIVPSIDAAKEEEGAIPCDECGISLL